ncbi:hypothetical protein V6N12_026652 [Hibiscus sabdariffa]|uniref:RNase H type-1 domain-containing protein n=1 Tax=Hibiscus sabdariffa TaxID=183260 RepID=A0ABR2DSE0_9ROSI
MTHCQPNSMKSPPAFACFSLLTHNHSHIYSLRFPGFAGSSLRNAELMQKDWEINLRHAGRASNSVADRLASPMKGQPSGEICFDEAPDKLRLDWQQQINAVTQ